MGDVRAAAANLPAELGVTLDPFPDSVPSGSFGAVLFGTHNASGRRVAVKLQRCVARGPYEAEVIRHLMTSAGDVPPPMIPAIIGEATAGNWHYLVMDGDTKENGWKEWMDAILDAGSNVGGPNVFREDYVAERFTQVLLGLLFMHAAGVAHLDVKLENIMLVAPNHPSFSWGACVIDFGLSKFVDPNRPANRAAGSEAYVAPELHRGEYDPLLADVFALGVTLFSAIAGFFPFKSTNLRDRRRTQFVRAVQALQADPQASLTRTIFSWYGRTVPHEATAGPLIALIDAMLSFDPRDRPSLPRVLQMTLEWLRVLSGDGGLLPSSPTPPWMQAAIDASAVAGGSAPAIAAAVARNAPGTSAAHTTLGVAEAAASGNAPGASGSTAAAAAAHPAAAAAAAGSVGDLPMAHAEVARLSLEQLSQHSHAYEMAMNEASAAASAASSSSSSAASSMSSYVMVEPEDAMEEEEEVEGDEPHSPVVYRSGGVAAMPLAPPLAPPRFVRQMAFVRPF